MTTAAAAISLDQLQVAAPCSASWEAMTGDERVRHCDECRMNVYNLSGMTRNEATQLVQQAEGRLCVRFYRRADGTVITKDCPVGLRAVRRAVVRGVSRVAAAIVLALGGLVYGRAITGDAARANSVHDLAPVSTAGRWLRMTDPEPLMGSMIMGEVACPAPAPVMGRMAAPAVQPGASQVQSATQN